MKVKLLPLLLFLSYPLQAMAPKAFALARYNNPKNTALIRHQRQGTMPQRMINSQKSVISATIYNYWHNNFFNNRQNYTIQRTSWYDKISSYLAHGSALLGLGALLMVTMDDKDKKKKRAEESIKRYIIPALNDDQKPFNENFINYYAEHFEDFDDSFYKLIENRESISRPLLKSIADKLDANNPQHKKIVAQYLKMYEKDIHISLLNGLPQGTWNAERYLKPLTSHFKKYFFTYAIENPEYLLPIIVAGSTRDSYELSSLALKYFDEICKQKDGKDFLACLASCNRLSPSIKRQITLKVLQLATAPEIRTLENIIEQAECNNDIMACLHDMPARDDVFYNVIKDSYNCRCGYLPAAPLSITTPTEKHLIEINLLTENVHREINIPYRKTPALRNLANTFNQKQKEFEAQGYATFVHGQQWHLLQKEEWFTYLYSLKFNKPINDFLFLHIAQPITDPAQVEYEAQMRKHIITAGRKGECEKDREVRDRQLFLNHFFFGNAYKLGSNSACYVTHNYNQDTSYNIPFKEIFTHFGYQDIHDKYAKELQNLEQEFAKLSQYGHVLFVAVPRNIVDDAVHAAGTCGQKESLHYFDKQHVQKEATTTNKILKKLDTKSKEYFPYSTFDTLEFCLAMTWDKLGGLNPDSGIKIFSINAADQEKLQAYRIKEKELMSRIEADIRAGHDKQSGGSL